MGAYIKEAKERHNRSMDSIWELEYYLNLKNAQKTLIKPIAFKPIAAPHPGRFAPSPQQAVLPSRLTPPNRSHDLKLLSQSSTSSSSAPHGLDDGYASQEYASGSHSHSTSNTSNSSLHDVDRSMSSSEATGGVGLAPPSAGSHGGGGRLLDRSGSYGSSSTSSSSSADARPRRSMGATTTNNHQGDSYSGHQQTPSPSDSGVGELETMLRDKDAEIQQLRETMEHNETVIFQVYEEKRQNWSMQLKEVVVEWERRLRHHQQKSFKMEQALLLQLFKLQQERNSLRLDIEQLRTERERSTTRITTLEEENTTLKKTLEEQQWQTVQKSGEIALLKAQLKEAKEEAANKTNDVIGVRAQLKDSQATQSEREQETARMRAEVATLRSDLEQLRRKVSRPKSDRHVQTAESRLVEPPPTSPTRVASPIHAVCTPPGGPSTKDKERANTRSVGTSTSPTTSSDSNLPLLVEGATGGQPLPEDFARCREQLAALQAQYAREKEQWLLEKDKVINYQKHLQLNYVQMFRKNKMLEVEMEQLMVELENKDLTLSETVASQTPDGFESTC